MVHTLKLPTSVEPDSDCIGTPVVSACVGRDTTNTDAISINVTVPRVINLFNVLSLRLSLTHQTTTNKSMTRV